MPKKGQSIYQELNNYDFLYQKRYEEKLELSQIANIVGCSSSAVFCALKGFSILRYPELEDSDFLWQKYWREKLTMSQIAEIVGCSHHTVGRALKRYDIRVRTKSECATGENNSMYGKHHSDVTIQKIQKSVSGVKNHNFGKPFTEDHKQRIGEANKNPSEETRKEMSERNKGEKKE